MTTSEILKASKNNSWTNVNFIIENSGLELNLIQNLPYCKMWEVKNNSEISHISNVMKSCGENISEVKFAWNK